MLSELDTIQPLDASIVIPANSQFSTILHITIASFNHVLFFLICIVPNSAPQYTGDISR